MSERVNSRLSLFLNRLEQSPNNPRLNVEGQNIYETAENILNVLERDSDFINEARYVRLILSKYQSDGREMLAHTILQIYEYYKTKRNLAINTIKDICKNLEKETGVKNIEIPQSQQQSNLPNPMQQSSQITSIPTSHNNFDFDRIKFELNVILLNKAQFLAFLYLQCTNYLAGINTLNKETDIPIIQNHIFTLELYRFWEYFLNHFSASLSQIDQNTFIEICHEYWIVNSNEDSFYITRLTNILSSNFSQFVQTFDYISLMHTNGNRNSEYTISSLISILNEQILNISLNGKNLYAGIEFTMGSAHGDRSCFLHSVLAHISLEEYLIIKNYVDVHDFICPWSNKMFLETVKGNIRKDIVNYEQVCYLRAYIVISIYITHQNNFFNNDNILELQTILGFNVIDPQTGLPTNSFVGYSQLPALAISQILNRPFLIIAPSMQINNAQYAQGYICTYKDGNGNWTYSVFSTNTMRSIDNISAHTKFIKEVMEGYEKFKCILLLFINNNHFVPFTPLGGKVLTDVEKFSNFNPSKPQPSTQQSAQLKPTPMVINQSQNQQTPISQQISPTSSIILQNQQQLTITPKTKELANIMQIFTFQAHIIPALKLLTEVLKALNKELGIRYNYINCLLEMFEDTNLRKDVLLAVANLYEISQKNPFYTFETILSLYDIWHSNPYFELPEKFNDITNDHEELFKSETFKSPSFIILFEIVQDKQKNHADITKAQEEFKNNENQLLLLKEKLKVLEKNVGSYVKYLSNLYCMFPDLGKIVIEQLYEIYFSFGDHKYVIEEIDNFRNILETRETIEESVLTALISEFSKEINEKFETYKNRQNLNSNTLTMTQNNNQFKETETIYEKIKTIGEITGQNVEFLYEFYKKYPDLKFSIEKLYLICTKRGSDYTKDKISELSRIYEKFANNNKPKATEIWITRILTKDLDKILLKYNKQFSSQQPQQNPFSKVTSNSFDSQSSSEPSQNHQQNFERQLTMNEMLEILRKDPDIGNKVMCLNELSKNGFEAMSYVTKLFEIYKKDKKYVSDVIRNIFSALEDWKSGKLSNDEKKADKTLLGILRNIFNDISNTHEKMFENPNQFKMQSNIHKQQSSNISNQKPSLQPKFASATGRATQYNKQFSTQQPQQNSFPQFTPNPFDLLQSNHQQQNFEMQPTVDEMLQTIETMTGQSTQNFREMFKIIPFSKNLIVAMYEICLKYPNYISTKIAILNNAEIFDEKSVFEIIYDILQKYEIYKNTQQMPSMFAEVRIRSNQYNNQQTQQNPIPQNKDQAK